MDQSTKNQKLLICIHFTVKIKITKLLLFDPKNRLESSDQIPIISAHFVPEVLLELINGKPAQFGDQLILEFKLLPMSNLPIGLDPHSNTTGLLSSLV